MIEKVKKAKRDIDRFSKVLSVVETVGAFFESIGRLFEESPEAKLERLTQERDQWVRNRDLLIEKWKKEDEKNTTYVLYFFSVVNISNEESKLREEEIKLFDEKIENLNHEIKKIIDIQKRDNRDMNFT